MMDRRVVAVLFAGGALLPLRANAQMVELTPHTGMYTPVGLLVEGVAETDNSFVRRKQLGSLMIGTRMTMRANHTFGLEGSLAYSPSLVAITDRDQTVDVGGAVTFASIRPVLRVHGTAARGMWSFHLAPGVGLVHRSGSAWNGTSGTTDRAFVLAGGWRLGRSRSAFRFDIEDYITRAAFHDASVRSAPRLHHDVIWSFGLSIPMNR
jgi:hypothetical protein